MSCLAQGRAVLMPVLGILSAAPGRIAWYDTGWVLVLVVLVVVQRSWHGS